MPNLENIIDSSTTTLTQQPQSPIQYDIKSSQVPQSAMLTPPLQSTSTGDKNNEYTIRNTTTDIVQQHQQQDDIFNNTHQQRQLTHLPPHESIKVTTIEQNTPNIPQQHYTNHHQSFNHSPRQSILSSNQASTQPRSSTKRKTPSVASDNYGEIDFEIDSTSISTNNSPYSPSHPLDSIDQHSETTCGMTNSPHSTQLQIIHLSNQHDHLLNLYQSTHSESFKMTQNGSHRPISTDSRYLMNDSHRHAHNPQNQQHHHSLTNTTPQSTVPSSHHSQSISPHPTHDNTPLQMIPPTPITISTEMSTSTPITMSCNHSETTTSNSSLNHNQFQQHQQQHMDNIGYEQQSAPMNGQRLHQQSSRMGDDSTHPSPAPTPTLQSDSIGGILPNSHSELTINQNNIQIGSNQQHPHGNEFLHLNHVPKLILSNHNQIQHHQQQHHQQIPQSHFHSSFNQFHHNHTQPSSTTSFNNISPSTSNQSSFHSPSTTHHTTSNFHTSPTTLTNHHISQNNHPISPTNTNFQQPNNSFSNFSPSTQTNQSNPTLTQQHSNHQPHQYSNHSHTVKPSSRVPTSTNSFSTTDHAATSTLSFAISSSSTTPSTSTHNSHHQPNQHSHNTISIAQTPNVDIEQELGRQNQSNQHSLVPNQLTSNQSLTPAQFVLNSLQQPILSQSQSSTTESHVQTPNKQPREHRLSMIAMNHNQQSNQHNYHNTRLPAPPMLQTHSSLASHESMDLNNNNNTSTTSTSNIPPTKDSSTQLVSMPLKQPQSSQISTDSIPSNTSNNTSNVLLGINAVQVHPSDQRTTVSMNDKSTFSTTTTTHNHNTNNNQSNQSTLHSLQPNGFYTTASHHELRFIEDSISSTNNDLNAIVHLRDSMVLSPTNDFSSTPSLSYTASIGKHSHSNKRQKVPLSIATQQLSTTVNQLNNIPNHHGTHQHGIHNDILHQHNQTLPNVQFNSFESTKQSQPSTPLRQQPNNQHQSPNRNNNQPVNDTTRQSPIRQIQLSLDTGSLSLFQQGQKATNSPFPGSSTPDSFRNNNSSSKQIPKRGVMKLSNVSPNGTRSPTILAQTHSSNGNGLPSQVLLSTNSVSNSNINHANHYVDHLHLEDNIHSGTSSENSQKLPQDSHQSNNNNQHSSTMEDVTPLSMFNGNESPAPHHIDDGNSPQDERMEIHEDHLQLEQGQSHHSSNNGSINNNGLNPLTNLTLMIEKNNKSNTNSNSSFINNQSQQFTYSTTTSPIPQQLSPTGFILTTTDNTNQHQGSTILNTIPRSPSDQSFLCPLPLPTIVQSDSNNFSIDNNDSIPNSNGNVPSYYNSQLYQLQQQYSETNSTNTSNNQHSNQSTSNFVLIPNSSSTSSEQSQISQLSPLPNLPPNTNQLSHQSMIDNSNHNISHNNDSTTVTELTSENCLHSPSSFHLRRRKQQQLDVQNQLQNQNHDENPNMTDFTLPLPATASELGSQKQTTPLSTTTKLVTSSSSNSNNHSPQQPPATPTRTTMVRGYSEARSTDQHSQFNTNQPAMSTSSSTSAYFSKPSQVQQQHHHQQQQQQHQQQHSDPGQDFVISLLDTYIEASTSHQQLNAFQKQIVDQNELHHSQQSMNMDSTDVKFSSNQTHSNEQNGNSYSSSQTPSDVNVVPIATGPQHHHPQHPSTPIRRSTLSHSISTTTVTNSQHQLSPTHHEHHSNFNRTPSHNTYSTNFNSPSQFLQSPSSRSSTGSIASFGSLRRQRVQQKCLLPVRHLTHDGQVYQNVITLDTTTLQVEGITLPTSAQAAQVQNIANHKASEKLMVDLLSVSYQQDVLPHERQQLQQEQQEQQLFSNSNSMNEYSPSNQQQSTTMGENSTLSNDIELEDHELFAEQLYGSNGSPSKVMSSNNNTSMTANTPKSATSQIPPPQQSEPPPQQRNVLLILNSSTAFDLFLIDEEKLTQNDLLRFSELNSPNNLITDVNGTTSNALSQNDLVWLSDKLTKHSKKLDHCSDRSMIPTTLISTYLSMICPTSKDTSKNHEVTNTNNTSQSQTNHISPFISPGAVHNGFIQRVKEQRELSQSLFPIHNGVSPNSSVPQSTSIKSQPIEPQYQLKNPAYNPACVNQFISAIFFIPLP